MKNLKILSATLLFFVGVNALVTGCFFIVDPSGSLLGMGSRWLEHSPFNDFLIPGIVLFILNGAVNILAASGIVLDWKYCPDLIVIQGTLLTQWIIVQAAMMQTSSIFHYLFAAIGIATMFCGIRMKQIIFTQ